MHGREPEALTDAEVRDAWGELVNMVGWNLKALVPPVSRLGLPAVLSDVDFACLGQRVWLTVLQPRR